MTRFSKLVMDKDGQLVETNVRVIKQEDMMKCPHFIMVPEHYRQDGSCRCDDPDHLEMVEWGYKWKDGEWQDGEWQ
jgi:hypothetical protein